jgi:hypothetical protein
MSTRNWFDDYYSAWEVVPSHVAVAFDVPLKDIYFLADDPLASI